MQIIAELVEDPYLRELVPVKQNEDAKPKMPYIAVATTVGKEISPGANIFNIAVSIEFFFDFKRDQTGASLDNAVNRANAQIEIALLRDDYGIIQNGEQPVQFVNDTVRKRVISLGLIAG